MHSLTVSELKPADPVLLGYIETYKWISTNEPLQVRTIPNGRLDAWISLSGRFWWQENSADGYHMLPDAGFFPLTRLSKRVKVEGGFSCISIKLFPHSLTLPIMAQHNLKRPLDFLEIFDPEAGNTLVCHLRSISDLHQQLQLLDRFFIRELFSKGMPNQWMREVITALEVGIAAQISMAEIAARNHVTIKTLERRFKKVFGVSPKILADLIRLQQAAKNIRQDNQNTLNHGDLNEALDFGYFDQSHFVKACKKITGLSPKQLFTQLPGRVTDFLIE